MSRIYRQFATIRSLLDFKGVTILLFVILGLFLFLTMYSNVKIERMDLEKFTTAPTTIRSPVTVSDKESTEKKREEAEAQVKDVYVVRKEINENRVDLITSIFDSVINLNKKIEAELAKAKLDEIIIAAEIDVEDTEVTVPEPEPPSTTEKVAMLKEMLTVEVARDISDSTFTNLVSSSVLNLTITRDLTITAINNVMKNSIPADEVENNKKRVEEELRYTNLNSNLKNAAIELGRYAIMQNEFFDAPATKSLREKARESVEPVKILQGQIIVEENQLINAEIFRQLELVGLLDSENSWLPIFGLFLLIIVIMAVFYYYFYESVHKHEAKQDHFMIFSIIFVLSIALLKGISLIEQYEYSELGYFFPTAMGVMLIKILIDDRLAFLWTIMIAVSGTIIFNEGTTSSLNMNVGIYILFSGIATILFLSKHNQRAKILQAGLFVSVVNLIVILSMVFLQNAHYSAIEYTFYVVSAFISGVTSAVLTIGLLPFFEAGFGILSTMKLIELSNPNHPLLRKILTEAPGTYHHSVMVANLAESACEAIGANGLLARVGCYYHDIGKTNRPKFFIENQINIENPHDKLAPKMSANIIISHATDGAEMLRKHRMPKEIVDIAEQHHGTGLIRFFYHKAKQQDENVDENSFRYPGPKAQSKEIAIIGIADSVEAAVRSMNNPSPKQIEDLVKNIITDRLQDGQLNDSHLTLTELEIVSHSLCESLKGIFHSRIEYPEMSKQKVVQA